MEPIETVSVQEPVREPMIPPPPRAFGVTVLVPERKKKKKKKYSRGLKGVQKFDQGLAKASRRVTRAVAAGFSTYEKESEKSAKKHRDGRIRYAFDNWAKAMSKTLRRASSAPSILADAINTKDSRRQFRNFVRFSIFPFPR